MSLWSTDGVDVREYLDRTGAHLDPASAPTAATLHELTTAHVRAIPFENVDVVLGAHPGLGIDDIVGKLVRRRRGGYCYEHVLLVAAVLEKIGFDVRRVVARVSPPSGPHTHATLVVRAPADPHPEREYLVDVGFGAAMAAPMDLAERGIVEQAGFPHRLEQHEIDGVDVWDVIGRDADGTWSIRHRFDRSEAAPQDYEVYHHYVSTHPRSPFSGQLVVMRLGEGISRRLVGHELIVDRADGATSTTPIGPDQLIPTLRDLDVELEPGQERALLAWWSAAAAA